MVRDGYDARPAETRRASSHEYPTTSGRRLPTVASGCLRLPETATAPDRVRAVQGLFSLVWQVLGSNQRRLSRRFYRPLPLATRATCLVSLQEAAERNIAENATACDVEFSGIRGEARSAPAVASDVTIGSLPV